MTITRSWAAYPAGYRAREMRIIARWISAGESGSVVGLPGSGRSNLLGFLCHRPEVLQSYLLPHFREVVLVPVDLNSLPANNLATLYRVLLRAFYRVCHRFELSLQQSVAELYERNEHTQDPFLAQSRLQDILLLFQGQQRPVVLVLNRFDQFCRLATPRMINTLRSLRDDFKDTLSYITGMTQTAAYLPDSRVMGRMYELLDYHICWVGSMAETDARHLITQATHAAPYSPDEPDISLLLALTGSYPILLKTACVWWLTGANKLARADWETALLAEPTIQHRLVKIWQGLTQEEQFILRQLQTRHTGFLMDARAGDGQSNREILDLPAQDFLRHDDVLEGLALKGVCRHTRQGGWQIAIGLLAAYLAGIKGQGRGKIWLDEETQEIYQGQTPLKGLAALEQAVLTFFIQRPRLRHTKTDLIINTWPDELRRQGVSDNSLYQVIFSLRQAIEPDPSEPVYLVTWRGKPEGGYQFFPEGRPK